MQYVLDININHNASQCWWGLGVKRGGAEGGRLPGSPLPPSLDPPQRQKLAHLPPPKCWKKLLVFLRSFGDVSLLTCSQALFSFSSVKDSGGKGETNHYHLFGLITGYFVVVNEKRPLWIPFSPEHSAHRMRMSSRKPTERHKWT